jgi:hypothetical protein
MMTVRRVLWWMAAAPADILDECDPCLQRRHTTRGLVFALNYTFLLCVWTDVGFHYFGWPGIICPGLIVPSVLVLGLGRLIAMYPRPTTSQSTELWVQRPAPSRWIWIPRVIIAVVLSSATTLSLMMIESRDLIHKSAAEVARVANSDLHDEKVREVNTTYGALEAAHKSRVDDLTKERAQLSDNLADATASIKSAVEGREQAVRETSYEKGGLDSRVKGRGPKFHAWDDLSTHYKDIADKGLEQQRDAAQSIRRLNDALDVERGAIAKLESEREQALSSITQTVRKDVGYIGETQGLFSDATLFLALYGRQDVGPGMWAASVVVVFFLFLVELSDLIAVSLSPCDVVPLGELASVRLAAAKLIAGAEARLARVAIGRPAAWIEARPDPAVPMGLEHNSQADAGSRS